jgi:hypothetical protein
VVVVVVEGSFVFTGCGFLAFCGGAAGLSHHDSHMRASRR